MLSGNSNLGIRIVCNVSGVLSLRTTKKKNSVSNITNWDLTLRVNYDHVTHVYNRVCMQKLMPFMEIAGFLCKSFT